MFVTRINFDNCSVNTFAEAAAQRCSWEQVI